MLVLDERHRAPPRRLHTFATARVAACGAPEAERYQLLLHHEQLSDEVLVGIAVIRHLVLYVLACSVLRDLQLSFWENLLGDAKGNGDFTTQVKTGILQNADSNAGGKVRPRDSGQI